MSSLKVLMLCQHTQGELEWSKEVRGYVLSSFFYGYVVTQVLGGWLAGRYGGKHVFGTSILITAIATILVPVAARTHVSLLITLRVIMGLASVHCKLEGSKSTPLGVVHIAHPLVYVCTPLKGCNRNTPVKGVKVTPFKVCV